MVNKVDYFETEGLLFWDKKKYFFFPYIKGLLYFFYNFCGNLYGICFFNLYEDYIYFKIYTSLF
jgi:hypothetical protein